MLPTAHNSFAGIKMTDIVYHQRSGELDINGTTVANPGYAGAPACRNNPAMEHVRNCGPLPRGTYTMEDAGRYITRAAIRLRPSPENEMYGRSGFLIHGDSRNNPGTASKGCIILRLDIRERLLQQIRIGNDRLEVR